MLKYKIPQIVTLIQDLRMITSLFPNESKKVILCVAIHCPKQKYPALHYRDVKLGIYFVFC